MSDAPRPKQHLIAAGKLYPGAWRQYDQFRSERGRSLPSWPDWCYCPLAASYAIVSGGGDSRVTDLGVAGDIGRLGALAAWRATQGIYRFDETLYAALIDTPVTGDIPVDVLHCLPEWCVYIETPEMVIGETPMAGFFAHLEFDPNNGRQELRLVMDLTMPDGWPLLPLPIHLTGSLEAGIEAASIEAQRQAWRAKIPAVAQFIKRRQSGVNLAPMVSLLLYLCSQNAEIAGDRRPANPAPKRTKQGWRLFPAEHVTTWSVGERIGSAIRAGDQSTGGGGEDTHAGPRPHIRRAHWHTYWVGKKGDQAAILKWLPPIPVNVDDADLPVTVRPVE